MTSRPVGGLGTILSDGTGPRETAWGVEALVSPNTGPVPVARRGSQQSLGRLRTVDPRTIWPNEALDFTPWLRENADVLADALGLDLEIHEAEVPVGGFNVDLVGEDVTNGRPLIVENQLGASDHGHLGQLLTYAGGLDAATIVWITTSVRDEHRQALDWLNRPTAKSPSSPSRSKSSRSAIRCRHPTSSPSPHRTIGAGTSKRAADQGEPSELATSRQRFFEQALEELKTQRPGITNARRVGLDNWLSLAAGRTGFSYSWVFTGDKRFRTELYIDAGDAATNNGYLRALARRREELEAAVGFPLHWDPMENRRASRVSASRPLTDADPADDGELRDWAVNSLLALNDAFRVPIRTLVPDPVIEEPADGGEEASPS